MIEKIVLHILPKVGDFRKFFCSILVPCGIIFISKRKVRIFKMDKKLLSYFNPKLKKVLSGVDGYITEIRLRKGRPVVLYRNGVLTYIDKDGRPLRYPDDNCIKASEADIAEVFDSVCRYSIHSFQENICSGFITLDGGHRVGICGTAVMRNGKIINVKEISGLNFRAAHEVKGCADELYNRIFSGGLKNVLIAGAPASGKTTLLRDLSRRLGAVYKTAVIDERSEIAAVYNGFPQNDVGINTDVFNEYSKKDGIETAVRVMSPEIIICDEAGNPEDAAAFGYAMTCGVKICASIHAQSIEDIKTKLDFYDKFDYIVFLDGAPGKIARMIRTDEYDKDDMYNFSDSSFGNDRKLFCG